MNCRKVITKCNPHPIPSDGGGGVRGENVKVTKHRVLKSILGMQLSCAIISQQIFWAKPGRALSEGGRVERINEWGGRRRRRGPSEAG